MLILEVVTKELREFSQTNRAREIKLEFWTYQRVGTMENIPDHGEQVHRSKTELLIDSFL